MRCVLRDPQLPHQIVIMTVSSQLGVSCNCLAGVDGNANHYSPIEIRSRWEWPEARAAYVAYHQQDRAVVPLGIGRITH